MSDPIIHPKNDERDARLGRAMALPSLDETLNAWLAARHADQPMDWPAKLADVRMTGDGRISRGRKGIRSTYRAFGTLVRNWSGQRVRNMAAVLAALPVATPEEQAAAEVLAKDAHSPRACAVNAFLRSGTQGDTVIFRTRLIDGVRTFVAPVTETHAREDSDDPVMIDALRAGFMKSLGVARASFYRGIDSSECRIVFPNMTVEAGRSTWSGYVTATNSETSARSWAVSAGLYRNHDGATLAVEATGKTGRHVGKAMVRMVEATETASALLRDLMRHAAEWMTRRCPWTEEAMIKRLGAALVKARATEDAIASIAMALAERGTELPQVIDAIATAAAGERAGRGAALPLEQMAGRLLVHGWEEGLTVKVQAGGEE